MSRPNLFLTLHMAVFLTATESCHNIAFMSGLPGSITVNTVMVMVRVKIMIRIIVQCYFIILQQYSPPYYHTADFAVKFNCGGIYHPQ